MTAGIAALTLGYVLSQFYRAFLAVLAPDLTADLGISAADLSRASGIWFLVFAAMQIPVGWALDRIGPRRTASVLLGLAGGGGAALMATAQSGTQIEIAMGLIGAGCAPVLMASYYIFARVFSAAVFATLAGALIGVGSLGNIAASLPLSWAAEALGWRGAMWGLAGLTVATALACLVLVRDPERAEDGAKGSVLDLLRIPAIWAILPMMLVNYAPSAGLRGLWAGPYVADVYGPGFVGAVTLTMGLAMIVGNFAYGPLDRVFGTRKWVVLTGNVLGALTCAALWLVPAPGLIMATAALALIGALGASFPMLMAHGRAFFPPHLVGRGVTLMNLFGIGGVGVMQFATGPLFNGAGGGLAGYQALFGVFAVVLLLGCAAYVFAPDKVD
ncbi:MFS transporter [Jannaschia pagri]|uniref:MFS transporter n=1 Tax=Jannaschia pagri TaxID=2829797 RepID=A0ABQ4NQ57_9RHOB|nr:MULTISPECIES: MFS transporter [unclassified Jannaschia]GIT92604.1 MFS transporter [Jannaschia sp. AI_61]GIT96536.1 MFS transporter [Jannaschia sp. AI_62]